MGSERRGAPAACGALGRFDVETAAGIAARMHLPLREVHRDESSVVFCDREPIAWGNEVERGLAWPERVPTRIADSRTWREAAAAGGCGLLISADGGRAVHASGSGIGPIYWLRNGDALYFATAIDPLVDAHPGPLFGDWESWSSIVALGYPVGAGTPFEGISRLAPLGRLDGTRDAAWQSSEGELAWTDVVPGDSGDVVERIADAVRAEVAQINSNLPVLCPLSGGFDSRLLACVLAEHRSNVGAWTVNIDRGTDVEETFAAAVAEELRIPHEVVEVGTRPFAEELEVAARRTDHESLLPLAVGRLADGLPSPGVVADGLAGDVLLKDLFVDRRVAEAPDWRTACERFFERLVSRRLGAGLLAEATWKSVYDTAREDFMSEAERFADHPSAPTLAGYWGRTRRGISPVPVRVYGDHHTLAIPFVSDEFARAALSVSLEEKLDGAVYRRVLERIHPRVARLPSTNDGLARPALTRRRLSRSREARLVYLDLLSRCPLRPWFSPSLEAAVVSGRLRDFVRSPWLLTRLQYLCNLTLWTDRYGDRLAEVRPGGPFAERASQRVPVA